MRLLLLERHYDNIHIHNHSNDNTHNYYDNLTVHHYDYNPYYAGKSRAY